MYTTTRNDIGTECRNKLSDHFSYTNMTRFVVVDRHTSYMNRIESNRIERGENSIGFDSR